MKATEPVTLTPPEQIQVSGRPNSNLLADLRWYLETFLELPTGANPDVAERVQASLTDWGKDCFEKLFQKQAWGWFEDARNTGLENLHLKIASDNPRILAWPWEALCDPHDSGTLAQRCLIERQLTELHDPLPLPENLPTDCINILLVIARPFGDEDVGFHALSRPMLDLLHKQKLPVRIDVLRPPTFAQLRHTLHEKPGFYHLLHFDGHGGYGEAGHGSATSADKFKGAQGKLIFETDDAKEELIAADKLSTLLAEYKIPIMVLNACQSAKIDEQADDADASVAAALLKACIRSVVAMAFNLYVSGAQEFVPAFYQRLLESGQVAEAARAGRQAMLAQDKRDCVFGEHPLQDWLVPVLYQQESLQLPVFQPSAAVQTDANANLLPDEAKYLGDYGFIGRGQSIQALERARLQQQQAAILIHGMAGMGKTTLAKGWLHWLKDTNGLAHPAFWFSFDEIRSAEYVINLLMDNLFNPNARALPLAQKLPPLVKALRDTPLLIVWDNFESACGIAGTEVTPLLPAADQQILKSLLKDLRGGQTKILITSRAPENWLSITECYRLPLSGLQGEDRWAYCNAVVSDLGLSLDRKNADFKQLMDALDGHPLAMRAILLRLPERSALALWAELQQQFTGYSGDESTQKILGALAVFDKGLPEEFARFCS